MVDPYLLTECQIQASGRDHLRGSATLLATKEFIEVVIAACQLGIVTDVPKIDGCEAIVITEVKYDVFVRRYDRWEVSIEFVVVPG